MTEAIYCRILDRVKLGYFKDLAFSLQTSIFRFEAQIPNLLKEVNYYI